MSVCDVLAYPAMSLWLNKTGRPILFSCSWPAYQEGQMKVSLVITGVHVERVRYFTWFTACATQC